MASEYQLQMAAAESWSTGNPDAAAVLRMAAAEAWTTQQTATPSALMRMMATEVWATPSSYTAPPAPRRRPLFLL
jgi:hypothetical protein